MCAFVLCLGGHARAQDTRQNRRRQKTENVANDTTRTLTHTMPLHSAPKIPKNPKVKFSNLNESLYIELQSFANATNNNIKGVFSPVIIIKPFIRFYDKFDVGITTTQQVQNYTSDKMAIVTHDMYAYAKLRTGIGIFSISGGKLSALNYAQEFSKFMPINNFFINAIYMKSGHYYPRAIIGGFQNKGIAFAIGYAEEDSAGFKFTGNGAFVISSETFIEDWLKCGLLVTIGKEKTVLDFQAVYTPNHQNAFLLELTNVRGQTGIHGTYRYSFKNEKIDIFANGFKQFNDGVAGGAIGIRHHSGAYATIGATYHDPMRAINSDATPSELYNKYTPYVEFGLIFKIKNITTIR